MKKLIVFMVVNENRIVIMLQSLVIKQQIIFLNQKIILERQLQILLIIDLRLYKIQKNFLVQEIKSHLINIITIWTIRQMKSLMEI